MLVLKKYVFEKLVVYISLQEATKVIDRLEATLSERVDIAHITFQCECNRCGITDMKIV